MCIRDSYVAVFTDRLMREAFRNNIMWIVFGATLTVIFGLLIAVLADRSRFERLGKSAIFLPMAISFVGAGVIWNFIYEVRPVDAPQIGLLNALVVAAGGQPQPFTAWTDIAPWNNLFLIVMVRKFFFAHYPNRFNHYCYFCLLSSVGVPANRN